MNTLNIENQKTKMDNPHVSIPDRKSTFALKSKSGINSIPFQEIVYCELVERRLYLMTSDGEELKSVSLQNSFDKAVAPFSNDHRFVRCHKSFVVNMDFVRELNRNNVLVKTGKRLPIAQSKQVEVKKKYMTYLKSTG